MKEHAPYTLIRSKRKTLSLSVGEDGAAVIRAPYRASKKEIEAFFELHRAWVEKKQRQMKEKAKEEAALSPFSDAELARLKLQAQRCFSEKAAFFAEKLGVRYEKLTVRAMKSRWGSCSRKKNLSFNSLLMLLDDEVRDAVAAHEVCHLKEMNHSARFYQLLRSVCPDYDRCNKRLKEEGPVLIARLKKTES